MLAREIVSVRVRPSSSLVKTALSKMTEWMTEKEALLAKSIMRKGKCFWKLCGKVFEFTIT